MFTKKMATQKKFLFLIILFTYSNTLISQSEKPNILFFLIDDIRNTSLGCYGHPIIKTPVIDGLAANGTRFTNAFVTTSICAASRASILTGLYESTHGYTFGKDPINKKQTDEGFSKQLKKGGYQTGFVGKWGMKTVTPAKELFDFYQPLNRNPYFHELEDGSLRHEAERCGDFAIEFIKKQHSEKPFCLQVSFNSVHAEDSDKENHYPTPGAVDGMYANMDLPAPRLNDPTIYEAMPDFLKTSLNRVRYYWRWDTPEKYQKNIESYFRMISGVDHVIGRVVQALKENGMDKNTIIVITGDNGYYMGDRGFAGKWSHFEESLRVPLIIYDPRLPEARINEQMALNIDLPATFLDYGGMQIPDTYQGKSLKPMVKGTVRKKFRSAFFAEHRMGHEAIPKWEGVRTQQYVYANYYEQQPAFEFLHDLSADPDQLKNLVADPGYRKVLKKMRKKLKKKEKYFLK